MRGKMSETFKTASGIKKVELQLRMTERRGNKRKGHECYAGNQTRYERSG